MAETQNYTEYRQRLTARVEQLITPGLNKILVFGDKFHGLEYRWSESHPEKKITNLDSLKKDWIEVTPDNPEFVLPVEKNSFDVLISYHGIEKAIDPERLLLELRKYLVKEGLFICITYNVGHISTILNLFNEGWVAKSDGALREGNIRHFSYESLKELLKMTGFDPIGEDIYGLTEAPEITNHLVRMTQNPYLNALSFIMRGKRVETFPFIEGTYP